MIGQTRLETVICDIMNIVNEDSERREYEVKMSTTSTVPAKKHLVLIEELDEKI